MQTATWSLHYKVRHDSLMTTTNHLSEVLVTGLVATLQNFFLNNVGSMLAHRLRTCSDADNQSSVKTAGQRTYVFLNYLVQIRKFNSNLYHINYVLVRDRVNDNSNEFVRTK